ncbi:MAG: GTPase-associated system all-helical protein GASH [Candidatus Velthaea sp.]
MMADAQAPPMHPDFARWYSVVALGENQPLRQGRWMGISSTIAVADRGVVEALIRLAFRTRQPAAPAALEKIRKAFKAADDTFDMHGNDRELEVLAGACLAVLMQGGKKVGAAAAIAVSTTAVAGARKPDLPMDLEVIAESAIDQIAEASRKRPDMSRMTSSEAPKFDFEQAAAKVREQPANPDFVAQAFTLAADSIRSALSAAARQQATIVQAIDNFLRLQDEELQMLWWLTGGRSWDYDCAFESVPAEAQPLVFAKELADSTGTLPGPASVKALLSRAGLKERKKLTIPAAINAADTAWLQKVIAQDDPSPFSNPIHFAIKRQLETGAGEAWIPGWEATTGVSAIHSMSSLTLGMLFYRERALFLHWR